MLKTIIFDLDDTLIDWEPIYLKQLEMVLKDYNFSKETILKIDDILDSHTTIDETLNINRLVDYINAKLNLNLPAEFLNQLSIAQQDCYKDNPEVNDVIKYLASKYDLYVLSNWFTETQKGRLKNMGILKYFKEVIGGDQNYYKPDKRAYQFILEKYKPHECLFIGDDLKNDIIPALELGMQAIWKTKEKTNTYQTIEELIELKEIL